MNRHYEYRFNINDTVKLYKLIKENFALVTIYHNMEEIVVFKEVPQLSFTSIIG